MSRSAPAKKPATTAAAKPASEVRLAVYSGTFDPLTLGHEDVIGRAARLFDQLIVAVAAAHHKKTQFTLEQRLSLARRTPDHVFVA